MIYNIKLHIYWKQRGESQKIANKEVLSMEVIASFIYSDLIKQDNYYLITNKSIRVKGIDANNTN